MTIHKVTHYDYSRDHGSHPLSASTKTEREVTDHLFVISLGGESLMVTVADTGLDIVPTEDTSKGLSIDWDQLAVLIKSGVIDHNGVVTATTDSESTADDVMLVEHKGTLEEFQTEMAAMRQGALLARKNTDPRECDCGKDDWCPLWDFYNGPGRTERDERVKETVKG